MWKDFLEFTKGERQGIIVLVILLFLLSGIYFAIPYFEPGFRINQADSIQIAEWHQQLMQSGKPQEATVKKSYYEGLYDTLSMFYFNPNTITREEWKALGLNAGQVETIMNYRNSGGRFYSPEDVKKMYTIEEKQYSYLKPWIRIPGEAGRKKTKPGKPQTEKGATADTAYSPDTLFKFNPNTISLDKWQQLGIAKNTAQTIKNYLASGARFKEPEDLLKIYDFPKKAFPTLKPYIDIPEIKREKLVVDLNKATKKELEALKGIGDYYSDMIIKYRNLLGGYYSKKQLLEVYNFRPETFSHIKDQVTANPGAVQKISLNTTGFKELIRHPYINELQTKEILELQKQGELQDVALLYEKKIFSDTIYHKIKHYLQVKAD